MRKHLAVAALLLAVVGLASCSKSKDEGQADTSAAPAPTTTGSESGGGTGNGSGALPEYCVKWGEIQSKYAETFKDIQQPPQLDPSNPQAALQQMQEVGQKLLAPMQEFQAVAPPEIKADVDQLVSGLQAMAQASPEGLAASGSALTSAGTNIGQFLATNCGGAPTTPTTSATGTDQGTGSGTGTGTATGAG